MPVSAADGGIMLYNGVELPDIQSVWTDSEAYGYVSIRDVYGDYYFLVSNSVQYLSGSRLNVDHRWISYRLSSGVWQQIATGTNGINPDANINFVWSNHDIINKDNGDVFFVATDAVDPNDPVIPDGGDSGNGTGGDSGDSSSILSAWYNSWTTWVGQTGTTNLSDWLFDFWATLYGIDTNIYSIDQKLDALLPSKEETALKAATAETANEFTKEFWDSESDNALGSASIAESADVLSNTKGLFDTGVSTSDFFGLFGDSSWGHWFSEETRADLHTVPAVSILDLSEDEEKSTYEKNLDAIRDFMGG